MAREVVLRLHFPELSGALHPAAVHVIVEDVAEADAPARELTRTRFTDVTVPAGTRTAMVTIALPDLADAEQPTLRVHVDTDGAGEIRRGHFVNPAQVPLGDADAYDVALTRVG